MNRVDDTIHNVNTHPTQQQLLAWLDDPADVGAGDWAPHVSSCARCQGVVESATALGAAVRLWADDTAIAPVPDLADRIFRAAGADSARSTSAAESAQPASAASVPPSAQPAVRPPVVAPVVPLASRRRWVVAVPIALAVAAAAVFVLTRPTRPVGPDPSGRQRETPIAVQTDSGAAIEPSRQVRPEPPPLVVAVRDELEGSQVLAVDPDGKHTNVSVMELAGEQTGTTVAVVWIDDQESAGRSAIQ